MNKDERRALINSLKPTDENKLIHFDDKKDLLPVYEVPLDYLTYNHYNGRIKAMTISWEKANHKLDLDSEEHKKIIEQFLWDSAPNRNEQTLQSIREYGQIEVGMITEDGVIIDGNRRASILNVINNAEEDKSKHLKFRTIILPTESIESTDEKEKKKEIVKLETIYQMGVDSKVDYNPIEKYLRCNELLDMNFTVEEISKMLSINMSAVQKMKEIFSLMNKYLTRYNYSGIYVGLEKKEGHFVDLRNYLVSYERGVGREYAKWDYNENDLDNMQNIYFDYARLRYPVQNCRLISNPAKSQSFFCYEDIWKKFEIDHFNIVEKVKENELDLFSERIKDKKINNIITERDQLWSNNVKDEMLDNLFSYKRKLEDNIKLDIPYKKLCSAKNTIDSIMIEDVRGNKNIEIETKSNEIITSVTKIITANNE